MATDTVTDLALLINQQIESRKELRESLAKATALLQVSLESDLLQHSKVTANLYLWAVYDIVAGSRDSNEQALTALQAKEPQLAVIDG